MYFPHRQVAREAATEEEEFIQEIVNRDHTHEKPPSRPKEQRQKDDQVQASDEVEISLHARDDDHYLHSDLHGDLKAASYPSEDQELTKVRPTDYTAALSESESENESARSQYGYDSSTTDDLSATPTAKAKIDEAKEPKKSEQPSRPPAPIGAVELKPYNHQVGGHSTVYRFSRRAVCKQLNNRENEFYETVERRHAELLDFLPR